MTASPSTDPFTTSAYERETVNAYLCRSPFTPAGVCSPLAEGTGMRTAEDGLRTVITVLVSPEAPAEVAVSLVPSDMEGASCAALNPPCDSADVTKGALAYRLRHDSATGRDYIACDLRLPDACFITRVRADYPDGTIAYLTWQGEGDIAGATPKMLFSGASYEQRALTSSRRLLPGTDAVFSFEVEGGQMPVPFATAPYEPSAWTSGIIKGAGLYENGAWVEGGEGFPLAGSWKGDARLRWLVAYRGAEYALMPSDYADYPLDSRAFIARRAAAGDARADGSFADPDAPLTQYDVLVPVTF